jgi:hypothetical protein
MLEIRISPPRCYDLEREIDANDRPGLVLFFVTKATRDLLASDNVNDSQTRRVGRLGQIDMRIVRAVAQAAWLCFPYFWIVFFLNPVEELSRQVIVLKHGSTDNAKRTASAHEFIVGIISRSA